MKARIIETTNIATMATLHFSKNFSTEIRRSHRVSPKKAFRIFPVNSFLSDLITLVLLAQKTIVDPSSAFIAKRLRANEANAFRFDAVMIRADFLFLEQYAATRAELVRGFNFFLAMYANQNFFFYLIHTPPRNDAALGLLLTPLQNVIL
jgi:hypothetical protein